jgi:hypothetical protein
MPINIVSTTGSGQEKKQVEDKIQSRGLHPGYPGGMARETTIGSRPANQVSSFMKRKRGVHTGPAATMDKEINHVCTAQTIPGGVLPR